MERPEVEANLGKEEESLTPKADGPRREEMAGARKEETVGNRREAMEERDGRAKAEGEKAKEVDSRAEVSRG